MEKEITITNIGYIKYYGSLDTNERLIAGRKILDIERKALSEQDDSKTFHLPGVKGNFSGELGFLDFQCPNKYGPELYISFIGVEPEHRQRGIGTRLLEEAEKIGLERKAPAIYTQVSSEEGSIILPFLKNRGYNIEKLDSALGTFVVSKNLS